MSSAPSPPSIPSSGEEGSPELPDVESPGMEDEDGKVALPDEGQCCNFGCLEALKESVMASKSQKELEMCLQMTTDRTEANDLKFDCLRHWQSSESGWRRFMAWGQPLCARAVQIVLQISRNVQVKWCKHLAEGYRRPPADLRKTQKNVQVAPVVVAAHSLLGWLYTNVAEVLVESSDWKGANAAKKFNVLGDSASLAKADKTKFKQTAGASWIDPPSDMQEVRWLNPGTTLMDMYDLSTTFNNAALESDMPSYKTFSRVYHQSWQTVLKVRPEGTHSTLDSY